MTRPVAIELSISGYRDGTVLFKVRGFVDDTVLGDNLTFDEVFAHTDWRVAATVHPLDVPQVDLNLRSAIVDLKLTATKLAGLREERSSTCDSARYVELTNGLGPLRLEECRQQVQRLIVDVAFKANTGLWPNEFDKIA